MSKLRTETKLVVVSSSGTTSRQKMLTGRLHAMHVNAGIYSNIGRTGGHFVIERGGNIELGRPVEYLGQIVKGLDKCAIHIIMIGGKAADKRTPEDNFTKAQMESLEKLVKDLVAEYPEVAVIGRPGETRGDYPGFDVMMWALDVLGVDNEEKYAAYVAAKEAEPLPDLSWIDRFYGEE